MKRYSSPVCRIWRSDAGETQLVHNRIPSSLLLLSEAGVDPEALRIKRQVMDNVLQSGTNVEQIKFRLRFKAMF
jgi:hypothetical protein